MRRISRTILALPLALPLAFGCKSTPSAPAASEAGTSAPTEQAATATAPTLASVTAGAWRTPEARARDAARHPVETLTFFGIKPDQTVVEITPGSGWYADVLAPWLQAEGQYVAAVWDTSGPDARDYYKKHNDALRAHFAQSPEQFSRARIVPFNTDVPVFGEPGSADAVVTFRNAHNWVKSGLADVYFRAFFDVLKPGGTLGVVDHRAKPGTTPEQMASSGYVTEDVVISIAESAGFKLAGKSEINANPRDTADHPNGVWSLPPSNRHEPADAEKYRAIGESDRMTLRFVKPAN